MTAQNNLELRGKISRNPVVELLVEISQTDLSGSLRLSQNEQKIVVYFDKGEIVFAASNTRKHRLFEILLNQEQISKENLGKIENFTNDFYLAKELVEKNLFTKETVNILFSFQIKKILTDAIEIKDGEWTFNSLARIKQGIRFEVDLSKTLYDHSKKLDIEYTLGRFKSFDEAFRVHPKKKAISENFTPQEAFILSRLGNTDLSINDLKSMSGLSTNDIMPALYRLWLGGFIIRSNWNSAFSSDEISNINAAKVQLKKSAISVEEEQQRIKEEKEKAEAAKAEEEAKRKAEEEKAKAAEANQKELSLQEYVDRVENAATHYEIFDVKPDAKISEIKKVYFSLAKNFHPDLYHKTVESEMHQKIQDAFTELAHAYETLKDEEAREVYDFKLRKVLEQLKEESGDDGQNLSKADIANQNQSQMAAENFDNGYDHLMNEEYEEALPYFGRAVHIAPGNARYHAFYGKALSFDTSQRHKAESELQAAIKIDSKNPIYRIMLAELFIEIGLKARAKGELNRLLKIAPNNQEAKSLLDSLNNK